MKASTTATLSAVLFLLILVPGAQAQDTSSPEASAASTMEAMAAADWTGMADLMHPEALNELRDLFVPLLKHPNMEDLRVEMFGMTTIAEVDELSGADVYQELIQFSVGLDPNISQALSTATLDVIGHVMEEKTAHVVYRLNMTVEEMSISQMAVASYKEMDGRWLGMLTADLRGMITGLEQMLE